MITRSEFDIDCTPVIPECGFECAKCVQEIESTLGAMEGVSKVYMEGGQEDGRVVVEHDPEVAAVEQLMDAFRRLPSFYKGFFVPALREN